MYIVYEERNASKISVLLPIALKMMLTNSYSLIPDGDRRFTAYCDIQQLIRYPINVKMYLLLMKQEY